MPLVEGLMMASMKFDATRAESLSRELDDPQFVGPDGEMRIADYLAGQLAKMGLDLERRDVAGSRFPQRVGPWVGWLGYGVMVTSMFGLIVQDNLFLVMGGLVLSFCSQRWANGVVCNWIRLGRRWPPIEAAPVLIATLPGHRPPRVRVVFQSVISGLNADPFHFSFRGPSRKSAAFAALLLIPFLLAWASLVLRCLLLVRPGRLALLKPYRILARYVNPALVVMLWVGILTCLSLVYLQSSRRAG